MSQRIKIKCENNNKEKFFKPGISLKAMAAEFRPKSKSMILGAMVNNKLKELSFEVYKPKTVRFVDLSHPDGMLMYIRSLSFVLLTAAKEVFPDRRVKIEHSISNGLYCEIEGLEKKLDIDSVFEIGKRMKQIIKEDIPFKREEIETSEAIRLFEKAGFNEKAQLFKTRPKLYTSVYYLRDQIDYFYGYLVPSTGYLEVFDLVKYYDGMLLMLPKPEHPSELQEIILQDKMFDIFREYKHWVSVLNIATIDRLNQSVDDGSIHELIMIAEALHENKLAQIADQICHKKDKVKIVLIAGPSSSGKTTFAKRLAIQLKVAGLKPVNLSLDNYFVDRELTPRDENGDYDFESLEAVDLKFFNQNLVDLLDGYEVELPKFSFEKGKRYFDGDKLKIDDKNIIIIEGIHALNPKLTEKIKNDAKFNIYISALTTISMDGHNRIPTTDTRLIRRIVRDHKFRGYTALDTISRWPSVRRGEEKHIFPFQEEADIMFNSALVYELGVLKQFVEPLLKEVHSNVPQYAEAQRLLKFVSYLTPVPFNEIPFNSILREFLGGSAFKY